MRSRKIAAALLVGIAGLASSPLSAFAEGLQITEILTPVLRIWKTPQAAQVAADIQLGMLPAQIPVEKVTPNRMLQVSVGGVSGYVLPFHVRTNEVVEVTVRCDSTTGAESFAGTRGIGEGCEK